MKTSSWATVGSPAPDLVYSNQQGETVLLAELWAKGPAMLVWLRHFG